MTLATVAGGGVVYAAVLLAIDREARKMVAAIWKEVRSTTKKRNSQKNREKISAHH